MVKTDPSPEAVLAERLEDLLALPLACEADLARWQDRAAELKADLSEEFAGLPNDMHWQIIYYLHDPDLRLRDAQYARLQEQIIRRHIQGLRAGSARLASQGLGHALSSLALLILAGLAIALGSLPLLSHHS